MDKPIYYLTAEEVKHYQYIIDNGYQYERINIGTQQYLVFEVIDKQYIGIAWPSLDGKISNVDDQLDTLLEYHIPLQGHIFKHLKNKNIKILLFPRYS